MWASVRRQPLALTGLVIIIIFSLIAIFGRYLAPYGPTEQFSKHILEAPSRQFLMGTDEFGRDILTRMLYGSRVSFQVGFISVGLAGSVGIVLGLIAGYLGGWTDRLVSRTADVMFGFPYLIFMIALGAVAPLSFPRPLLLIVLLGFFGWPRVARVVRAQTLTLRRRTFVSASRVMGAGTGQVLRRQILPNLWVPIIVVATLLVPERIGAEAALSFLGAGIPPPWPSWGRSIGDAVDWVSTDPMFLVFPGGALFLATLALNLLGDGLRDAFDPRMSILTGGRR